LHEVKLDVKPKKGKETATGQVTVRLVISSKPVFLTPVEVSQFPASLLILCLSLSPRTCRSPKRT